MAHGEVPATALLQFGTLLCARAAGPLAQGQILMGEQARIAIVGGEQLTQFGVGEQEDLPALAGGACGTADSLFDDAPDRRRVVAGPVIVTKQLPGVVTQQPTDPVARLAYRQLIALLQSQGAMQADEPLAVRRSLVARQQVGRLLQVECVDIGSTEVRLARAHPDQRFAIRRLADPVVGILAGAHGVVAAEHHHLVHGVVQHLQHLVIDIGAQRTSIDLVEHPHRPHRTPALQAVLDEGTQLVVLQAAEAVAQYQQVTVVGTGSEALQGLQQLAQLLALEDAILIAAKQAIQLDSWVAHPAPEQQLVVQPHLVGGVERHLQAYPVGIVAPLVIVLVQPLALGAIDPPQGAAETLRQIVQVEIVHHSLRLGGGTDTEHHGPALDQLGQPAAGRAAQATELRGNRVLAVGVTAHLDELEASPVVAALLARLRLSSGTQRMAGQRLAHRLDQPAQVVVAEDRADHLLALRIQIALASILRLTVSRIGLALIHRHFHQADETLEQLVGAIEEAAEGILVQRQHLAPFPREYLDQVLLAFLVMLQPAEAVLQRMHMGVAAVGEQAQRGLELLEVFHVVGAVEMPFFGEFAQVGSQFVETASDVAIQRAVVQVVDAEVGMQGTHHLDQIHRLAPHQQLEDLTILAVDLVDQQQLALQIQQRLVLAQRMVAAMQVLACGHEKHMRLAAAQPLGGQKLVEQCLLPR